MSLREIKDDRCALCTHPRGEHYRDAPMGAGCWHQHECGDCGCPGFKPEMSRWEAKQIAAMDADPLDLLDQVAAEVEAPTTNHTENQ